MRREKEIHSISFPPAAVKASLNSIWRPGHRTSQEAIVVSISDVFRPRRITKVDSGLLEQVLLVGTRPQLLVVSTAEWMVCMTCGQGLPIARQFHSLKGCIPLSFIKLSARRDHDCCHGLSGPRIRPVLQWESGDGR